MKRLSKEYKLNVSDLVHVKYGTTNKSVPKVIYVTCKCWVTPPIDADLDKMTNYVEKKLRHDIKALFIDGNKFGNRFIFDFDMKYDDPKDTLKKFLSFEFYLIQKEMSDIKTLYSHIQNNCKILIDELVDTLNNEGYVVDKKK